MRDCAPAVVAQAVGSVGDQGVLSVTTFDAVNRLGAPNRADRPSPDRDT